MTRAARPLARLWRPVAIAVACAVLIALASSRWVSPDHMLASIAWKRVLTADAIQLVPRFSSVRSIPPDTLSAAIDSVANVLSLPRLRSQPEIVLAQSRRAASRWNGGHLVPGMFMPPDRIVLASDVRTPVLLLHELVHWQLQQSWGAPHQSADWLNEGLATFIAGRCAGHAPRALAAAMRRADRLPALSTLLTNFRTLANLDAYISAASLVEWLVETDQRPLLLHVWRSGTAALPTLTEFESAWHTYLADGPRVAWQPELGCFGPRRG